MSKSIGASLSRGVFAVALSSALVIGTAPVAPVFAASGSCTTGTTTISSATTSNCTLDTSGDALAFSSGGTLIVSGTAVSITNSTGIVSIDTSGASDGTVIKSTAAAPTINITGAGGFTITNGTGKTISNTKGGANDATAITIAANVTGTINNYGTISTSSTTTHSTAIDNSANTHAVTFNLYDGSTITGAVKTGTGGDVFDVKTGTVNLGSVIKAESGTSSATIIVEAGATLNASNTISTSGYNNIVVKSITLNSGSTLASTGSNGNITSNIDGDVDGDGALIFSVGNTITGNVGSTHSLASLTVADGKTGTIVGNVVTKLNGTSTTVQLGTTGGAGTGSLVISGSNAVFQGVVDTTLSGKGAVTFSGGGTVTFGAGTSFGQNTAFTSLFATSGTTLDLTQNGGIPVTLTGTGATLGVGLGLAIGSSSTIKVGSATFNVAQITGAGLSSRGTLEIAADRAFTSSTIIGGTDTGSLTTATTGYSLSSIVVDDGVTLDVSAMSGGPGFIGTDTIVLGSSTGSGSKLVLGALPTVSGSSGGTGALTTIDAVANGGGTVEFAASNEITGNIGATHALGLVILDASNTLDLTSQAAVVTGTISAVTSTNPATLTVTSVSSGTLYPGASISGSGVSSGSIILAQLTGTPGGAGTYSVSVSQNLSTATTISVSLGSRSIAATTIQLGSGSSLVLGTGAITGDIVGDSTGHGTVTAAASDTITGNVGTTQIAALNVNDGKSLTITGDLNAAATTVGSSTGGSATLTVGGSSIGGAIDSSSTGQNTLVVSGTATLASGASIGTTTALGTLKVTGSLDTSTNDNTIIATNILLGSGATLTLGAGTTTGAIAGDAAGHGTLEYAADQTTTSDVGTANKLASILIDSGKTLTLANTLSATTTTVQGTLALGSSSETINGGLSIANGTVDLGTKVLTVASGAATTTVAGGTLQFDITDTANGYLVADNSQSNDLSTMTIAPTWSRTGTASDNDVYVIVSGYGSSNPTPTVTAVVLPSSGENWTISVASTGGTDAYGNSYSAGDLIMTATSVYVPAPYIVYSGTTDTPSLPSAITSADQVIIGGDDSVHGPDNAGDNLNDGHLILDSSISVAGTIDGDQAHHGTLEYSGNNTVLAAIGSTYALHLVQVDHGATVNLGNNALTADQVTIGDGSAGTAELKIGTGAVNAPIDGAAGTTSVVEYTGTNTLHAAIGASTPITSLIIDDGITLSTGTYGIAATTVTLGNSAGTGAQLTMGGSTVTGNVTGLVSGKGKIVASTGSNTITGNVGTTKLNTVTVNDGASLTITGTLGANNTVIGSSTGGGATLTVGGSSITGAIDSSNAGQNTLVINGATALAASSSIGSNKSLALITINAGKSLDTGTSNTVAATQVTLNSGSTLKIGTGTVTGKIDGNAAGNGTLEIAASGTNTLGGNVGSAYALGTLQVDTGATLVNGSKTVDANAINLQSGATLKAGTGAITGVINGTASGNGTLEYTASTTTTSDVGATNKLGSILIDNAVTLTLANNLGATTTTINSGASGGTLALSGNRTVTGNLANNGTLSLGTNTLTVASGALTGSGIVKLDITDTANGYIVNNGGTATLASMTIQPTWSSSNKVSTAGATYVLVQNYGGGPVVTAAITASGSGATWTTEIATASGTDTNGNSYSIGDLLLIATSTLAAAQPGVAPQNAAPVDSLNTYTGSDSSTLALQTAVNGLTDPADIDRTGAQLRPDVNALTSQTAFGSSTQFLNVVEGHNDNVRTGDAGGSGIATGEEYVSGGVWGQFFGTQFTQGRVDGIDGYTGNTWGIALGVDKFIGSSVRLGIAGGYAASDVSDSGTRAGSSVQVTSYFGTLDGSFIGRTGWYVDGALTYGRHGYISNRYVSILAETAQGSFDADQYGARLATGYPLHFGRSSLTPVLSADYNLFRQGGYTETGAPGANLTVDSAHTYSLRSGLGLKFATTLFGGDLKPNLHGAWYHEFNDKTFDMSARYAVSGGPSFQTSGIRLGTEDYNVGTGFDLLLDDDVTLSAQYDYDERSSYSANTGKVQLHVNF